MNADALSGMVLGTCTLQKLIGQEGLGAIFQAQQARPPRQVAVKVLSPKTSLTSSQRADFLQRLRREIDAIASLEHPNILPIYEHGEQDGVAYLVMPYVTSGTLRDAIEREGPLPLPKVMDYLDQLAAALDFAHEEGIIHYDIKPSNVFLSPEGPLLLADFGLMKVMTDGMTPQMRLITVGTPDYLAPEQIKGDAVDKGADLYSLGVLVYQMVTGKTPFQGEMSAQIAIDHLQTPPPSPRAMRTELPLAAEQVMLRAMAKRSTDRYGRAQDFASALRVALTVAGISPDNAPGETRSPENATAARLFSRRGLFDPVWQPGTTPPLSPAAPVAGSASIPSRPKTVTPSTAPDIMMAWSNLNNKHGSLGAVPVANLPVPNSELSTTHASLTATTSNLDPVSPLPATSATGSLLVPGSDQGNTSTMKLVSNVKVVQVPVAGQPGRYVTGLLPVLPQQTEEPPAPATSTQKNRLPMLALIVLALLVIFGSTTFWFIHTRSDHAEKNGIQHEQVTTNLTAIAAAQITATVKANTILLDPLDQNIHNWPVATSGTKLYVFENGAYHITDNDNRESAPSLLHGANFTGPLGYALTMEEIKGDDTSLNNSFGMIMRFSSQQNGSKTITTFYSFEVVNMKGGEYQFWKYNDSKGPSSNPWKQIWHHTFGSEFHVGHGPKSANTIKVLARDKNFSFTVNGKNIGNTQDNSITSGEIGMLVNLKGTEVAFSDLRLTRD